MKKLIPAKSTLNVRHANRDVIPIAKKTEETGKKVLYLNTGDPIKFGFRTPEHIWEEIESRRKEAEGYANAIGTESAREAIAQYAKRMGAHGVDKEDVINFVGGSEAIIISLQALLDRGESISTPRPGYSVYSGELNFLGCTENRYDLLEEENWGIDEESLRKSISGKTKAVLAINPNNPTGGVLAKKELEKIIDVAGEHGLPVISDETYDQLVYDDEKFHSMAGAAKDVPVISLGSISKNYLAPGFRAGWIYKQDPEGALDDYFEAIKRMCRLRLSNTGISQIAIEAALNGPQEHVKGLVETLEKRRDLAYKRLNEIRGIGCTKPKGAFYAFPKIELPIESDREFTMELLREKGILVVFGSGFGQKEGTKHFRLVFLPPEETLETVLNAIEEFVNEKYP